MYSFFCPLYSYYRIINELLVVNMYFVLCNRNKNQKRLRLTTTPASLRATTTATAVCRTRRRSLTTAKRGQTTPGTPTTTPTLPWGCWLGPSWRRQTVPSYPRYHAPCCSLPHRVSVSLLSSDCPLCSSTPPLSHTRSLTSSPLVTLHLTALGHSFPPTRLPWPPPPPPPLARHLSTKRSQLTRTAAPPPPRLRWTCTTKTL